MKTEARRINKYVTNDSFSIEHTDKLLNSSVRLARMCFTDAEIIEHANRALMEAANEDAAEQAEWDASWPTLF